MAKKSSAKKTNILKDTLERLRNGNAPFIIGLIVAAFTIYLAFSLLSFFVSGGADQSLPSIDGVSELQDALPEALPEAPKNSAGLGGAVVANYLVNTCFGWSVLFIVPFLAIIAIRLMAISRPPIFKWFICTAFSVVWGSVFSAFAFGGLMENSFISPGGRHGENVVEWLTLNIGPMGLTLLLLVTLLLFMIYLTRKTIEWLKSIFTLSFVKGVSLVNRAADAADNSQREGDVYIEEPMSNDDFVIDVPVAEESEEPVEEEFDADIIEEPKEAQGENPADDELEMEVELAEGDNDTGGKMFRPINPRDELSYYKPPTIDLLDKYDTSIQSVDMNEQQANKMKIKEVLKNFDIEISSIKATIGPTITLYEVTPAPGVRILKIRNLEDDIAMSLSALCIRIIAPIPGKGTVGIEVPNTHKQIVPMASLLNSRKFKETDMALPLALGKTISNEVFMVDMAKMPHLLVAGATGMGKSVGLNAIITSLLYKMHPAYLKFVMVDPKMVELSLYNVLEKHFLAKLDGEDEPIITDVHKVVRTLKSLCTEMDNRYRLLQSACVRSVKEYNEKYLNKELLPTMGHRFMPYIVVVIDEYGDLMMTAGKEVEQPIARIAQKARAVGIHMIIATQRPTTNIITGTIKANFPARMAFRVISVIDSRTILDRSGANQLQGKGDMLFLAGNDPVRVQCALVETKEVERVCAYIAKQQAYPSAYILPEPEESTADSGVSARSAGMPAGGKLDELFIEAARTVVLHQQGSTSLLQRKFNIGFNRAGRIMDQLCQTGIVGEQDGSKPRQVLCSDETDLEFRLKSIFPTN